MEAEDPVTWIFKTIQKAPEGEIESNNKICIEGFVTRTVWDTDYVTRIWGLIRGMDPAAVTT